MSQRSEPSPNGGAVSTHNDRRPQTTDLKQRLCEAERTLSVNQEELCLALSVAELGLWDCDLVTGAMTGTPAFLDDLGLNGTMALSIDLFARTSHPDDAARVQDAIDAAIEGKRDYTVTYRVIRADGSVSRVVATGRPVYANGKPIRLIGVTRAVSDADHAKGQIDAAQQRQRFLLDLKDRISEIDEPNAISDVASSALATFLDADSVGFGETTRSEDVFNREWVRASGEAKPSTYNLAGTGEIVLAALNRGETVRIDDCENDIRLDGASRHHFSEHAARSALVAPLIKNGRIIATLTASSARPHAFSAQDALLGEDVAERIWAAIERAKTETSLRESEARLRIVAETLPALVWIITPELELVYANARWSKYSGLPENEALGFSWMDAVHPDDLARILTDVKELVKNQSAYAMEARYRNRDGMYRWHMIRAEPIHDARGTFRGWSGTSVDIHDLKETEAALRNNEAQLRIALQAASMGVWMWDRVTDVLELSDSAASLFGVEPGGTIKWAELRTRLDPSDALRAMAAVDKAVESGEPYDIEYRLTHPRDGRKFWLAAQGHATYDAAGTMIGMTGVVQDITDRKRAEEQQNLLIRELHHRVKNTLATVQAIVGSTARTASSIDEFYQGFVGRIVSLARTHNLLTDDLWQKASLDELIENELGPYDDDNRNRIVIDGPMVELPSEAAVPIGMAIHELTTNAAKHGALSTFGGQVEVRWRLDGDGEKPVLHFEWTEKGGPRVAQPTRQGFGSRLLQRVLTTQLQADVHMDFAEDGLRFKMVLPVPGEPPLFNPDT